MSLVSVGTLSLAVAVPGGAGVAIAGAAGITAAIPDIQARISALLAFSPLPGNFAADITLANSIIASITAALSLGLSPPSLSAQIAAVAALVAALEAQLVAINANLTICTNLTALLAAGGVFAYAWTGRADGLGPALTTELAGGFPGGAPGDASNALVLGTTTPATWTAMSSLFKVTP